MNINQDPTGLAFSTGRRTKSPVASVRCHRRRRSMFSVALASAGVLLAGAAQAQDLPTPNALISQLDLECRRAQGARPVQALQIQQLNEVIAGDLPNQNVMLGPLEDVCVPVAKNGQIPGPRARAIAEHVDLACYRATAAPVDVDVTLSHLNPQLAGLPDQDVKLVNLRQLCVPVSKQGDDIPAAVKAIVRHLDLACYQLATPTAPANQALTLTHLNPVIRQLGLPNRVVQVQTANQLCVPVRKNGAGIPDVALQFIRWADFLKYRVQPNGQVPPLQLVLTHLNPLFGQVAPFQTTLVAQPGMSLLVPVAKDGEEPPGAMD